MFIVLKGNFLHFIMERPELIDVIKFDNMADVEKWIRSEDWNIVKKVKVEGKILYVVNDGFNEFEVLVLEV